MEDNSGESGERGLEICFPKYVHFRVAGCTGADVIVTIDVRNRKSRIILVADCPGKIFETDIQLFSPSLSVLEQASVIELMIKNIVRRHNLANCFIEEQFVFRAGCQNYSCHVVSRT